VEKIVDQTGTYAAPPSSPGVVGLTTGNDTIVTPSTGSSQRILTLPCYPELTNEEGSGA
jgi:hypothetical protein